MLNCSPLEIVNRTVLDSFNHLLSRMEWTDVLLPGRCTVFNVFLSQISFTLTGWVKFPIADGTHLLFSKLWTFADGLVEVQTNLWIRYNFSWWEVTVCGKLVSSQDTCLLIRSLPALIQSSKNIVYGNDILH